MKYLKQSTAVTLKIGPFLDDTDFKTVESGLTISQEDVRLSKNGGNFAQKHESSSGSYDELGFYDIDLDTTDTNTLGRLKLGVNESGVLIVWDDFSVLPANVFDSMFSTDKLQVDMVQIDGETTNDNSASLKLAYLECKNSDGPGAYFEAGEGDGEPSYPGLKTQGVNGGSGMENNGGVTGHGIENKGGSTSGHGMYNEANNDGHGQMNVGEGADAHGIRNIGDGSGAGTQNVGGSSGHGQHNQGGATANGLQNNGGSTSGNGQTNVGGDNGVENIGGQGPGGNGIGMKNSGFGNLPGIRNEGGTTSPGMENIGGSTSGDGQKNIGKGNGNGIHNEAGGSGHGLLNEADETGDGQKNIGGSVAGNGVYNSAPTAGDGFKSQGGSTFGRGIGANEIGIPFYIDGVPNAGILEVLKKIVDDNGGADFDATTDSLEKIASSGATGLSAQQVRDAMKLAPTSGAPAAGSVDDHLDDILEDVDEMQGKLPTNFIMGSGVATDKDDEVDTVLTNTQAIQTIVTQNNIDIATVDGKVDIVDTNVDTLLTNTTDIEAKIDIIDTNVDAVLVDTDEIQSKLPTNNIMGSSDKTDKDDEIDNILGKVTSIESTVNDIESDTNDIHGKLPTNNIMGSSNKTDKDDEIDALVTGQSTINNNVLANGVTIDNLNNISAEDVLTSTVDADVDVRDALTLAAARVNNKYEINESTGEMTIFKRNNSTVLTIVKVSTTGRLRVS